MPFQIRAAFQVPAMLPEHAHHRRTALAHRRSAAESSDMNAPAIHPQVPIGHVLPKVGDLERSLPPGGIHLGHCFPMDAKSKVGMLPHDEKSGKPQGLPL